MPGAGRVSEDLVGGTGLITGPGSASVQINSKPASVVGDICATHGESPHTNPPIMTGSSSVIIDGKPAVVQGISQAQCGHNVTTGSPDVLIGN